VIPDGLSLRRIGVPSWRQERESEEHHELQTRKLSMARVSAIGSVLAPHSSRVLIAPPRATATEEEAPFPAVPEAVSCCQRIQKPLQKERNVVKRERSDRGTCYGKKGYISLTLGTQRTRAFRPTYGQRVALSTRCVTGVTITLHHAHRVTHESTVSVFQGDAQRRPGCFLPYSVSWLY